MSYHSLSECTLDAVERLEEAGRIVGMLTASTATWFQLSLKERAFVESIQTSCSVRQLFWLRDLKDKYLF